MGLLRPVAGKRYSMARHDGDAAHQIRHPMMFGTFTTASCRNVPVTFIVGLSIRKFAFSNATAAQRIFIKFDMGSSSNICVHIPVFVNNENIASRLGCISARVSSVAR